MSERMRNDMTFSEWKASYDKDDLPFLARVRGSRSVWHFAFALRIRHPDRFGFFGEGRGGWCWPWNWYTSYFAALMVQPTTGESA